MYTPSRNFQDFYIAGFKYYDGLDVIDELKTGTPITLKAEPDNPHDTAAVEIYYKDTKLGYIPRNVNSKISTLLVFGHASIFESRIISVNAEQPLEQRFQVVLKVKDNRDVEHCDRSIDLSQYSTNNLV